MWRSLFRTGADPPAPSLSVHTPVKRAMTIDTKCLTVVDVEGRKRFVCDAPNVMRVQVDRIPSPASSAAALARVVILLEHGFSPHAVFWRQMRFFGRPPLHRPLAGPRRGARGVGGLCPEMKRVACGPISIPQPHSQGGLPARLRAFQRFAQRREQKR